ncbi:AN1-type zinc finger protein 3-like isoform X2 [Takifugu rubripes]|nr:AN1-type zinc finger protein 3-like isoform X2 [Takifugu rubripes]
MNLCSKCFADVQKKQPEDDVDDSKDCSPKNSSNCSQTDMYCNETDGSIRQSLSTTGHLLPVQVRAASFPPHAVSPESDLLPNKRARLREVPEDEESSSLSSFTALSPSCSSAKQRSRRRCHFCRTKLELVQQEMGSCRCGFVFCSLHRLPEQHGCLFDHLGHGRQEAVQKVVKLRRKFSEAAGPQDPVKALHHRALRGWLPPSDCLLIPNCKCSLATLSSGKEQKEMELQKQLT